MEENNNQNDENNQENNTQENNNNEEQFGLSNEECKKEGILRTQSIDVDEKKYLVDSNKNEESETVPVQKIKSVVSRTSTKLSLPPPERRESFQVRAMFRKTLSYQKRQMGTNICCVGVCPTFMIILSYLLSILIEYLLEDIIKTEKYEYCTNEFNGQFILPNTNSEYKKDEPDVFIVHHTEANTPCSSWFGTTDYFSSYPYDILPENSEANFNRDTTFMPSIDIKNKASNYGYILNAMQSIAKSFGSLESFKELNKLGQQKYMTNQEIYNKNFYEYKKKLDKMNEEMNKNNNQTSQFSKRALDLSSFMTRDMATIQYITDNIIRPWAFVAINKNNATDHKAIGERTQGPSNYTLTSIHTDKYELSNKGYLDYTYTRYGLNLGFIAKKSPNVNFDRLPYFETFDVENEEEVDDILTERMNLLNKILSNTTFENYSDEEKKKIDITKYSDRDELITKSVDFMPYAVLYYKDIDEQKLKYNIIISIGEHKKLKRLYSCEVCSATPYMAFPGRGKRLLYFITELSNSVVRKITDNKKYITQGFRAFPEKVKSGLPIDLGSLIGIALFPWGVSFLLPIFTIVLVKEKEERFLVMMNMNGIKSSTYYISVYCTNLILSVISMACFIIAGMICGLNMFTKTSLVMLIIVFFIWANVQVALSFALSFFFSRNGTALIASFMVVLLSIVFSLGLTEMFETTNFYFLWAPFAFYYVLSQMSTLSVSKINPAYQLHNFIPGNKIFTATMYLIFDFCILILLSIYFDAVIPQEFGSHQPWHLNIVSRIKKLINGKEELVIETPESSNQNPFYTEEEEEAAKKLEDNDVRDERNRILSGKYDHNSPLIIKNARKEYAPRVKGGKPHVAVHSVTFAVEDSVVFGLLGPNGAGKTTLIHSLIGVYTLTSGYAKLAGFNVKTDMDQVYKRIGICPQHDILWDDLTVEEHLLFYARLKGITKEQEMDTIQESMASVGLEKFRNNLVRGLSGGEKRRLSIAIALVGDPKLVFLDEPTTGLDPDVRRLIWGILNEISRNRTIIITTHSMEEAEVLCHRIGIMSHGTLRCCATPLRLKELYGSGFKLSYSNQPEKYRELKEFVTSIIPAKHKVVRDLSSTSIYEFIPTQGLISKLFEELEGNKEKYGIIDWGISQSSLEEVFLSIISDDDADAS